MATRNFDIYKTNIKEEVKVGNIDSRVFQTMSKILKALRQTYGGPVENEIHSESRTSQEK